MSTEMPPSRPESGAAGKLQILATEHWSLLATRSLTYTESLNRVTIFLAILSGAMIALALVAQVDRFGPAFISIAIPLLTVVLYTGIATIARLHTLNRDDFRWVIGMNRLRHAYLELHPELEPHFIASPYDDMRGALQTLGIDDIRTGRRPGSLFHLLQTLPGMLTVIVAAVGAAIGALAALAIGSTLGLDWLIAMAAAATAILVATMTWPPSRQRIIARAWCVMTPHRVRAGCKQAWIQTRDGRLPVVLYTAPADFGERVWLWCRAGITAGDLVAARDILRAACWASESQLTFSRSLTKLAAPEPSRSNFWL